MVYDHGGLLRKRDFIMKILKDSVENFLCRDDNSRVKAGKRSTKTFRKRKQQIRLLIHDSLKKLHLKYNVPSRNKQQNVVLFVL